MAGESGAQILPADYHIEAVEEAYDPLTGLEASTTDFLIGGRKSWDARTTPQTYLAECREVVWQTGTIKPARV